MIWDWILERIISILVLCVTIFTLAYTIYKNREQSGADIQFQMNKELDSNICEFIIENKGNQDAEDFNFLINGRSPDKYNHELYSLRVMNEIMAEAKHLKKIEWSGRGKLHVDVKASYKDKKGEHEN